MTREFVTVDRLREILNERLHAISGCEDVDFQSSILQYRDTGEHGENWSTDVLTFHGRSADTRCAKAAEKILVNTARQYSVSWQGSSDS